MSEANKDLVRRYQEAYNSGNLVALDEILSPDLKSHSLFPGLPPGLEGAKMAHRAIAQSFPDLHIRIDDLIAEGDKVVEVFTETGTHEGEFMGAPPSGKRYSIPGVSVFRVHEGRVVEHWGHQDTLMALQQLGMMPGPAQ